MLPIVDWPVAWAMLVTLYQADQRFATGGLASRLRFG